MTTEIQCWEGDGVRPFPADYDEVVERLAPIFRECNRKALEDHMTMTQIVMQVTGLTRVGLLADRLTRVVHEKTDHTLSDAYALPVDRLAAVIGRIVLEQVLNPEPTIPPGLCYNCGEEETEDHVCGGEAVEKALH